MFHLAFIGITEPGSPPERGSFFVHGSKESNGFLENPTCLFKGPVEHLKLKLLAVQDPEIPPIKGTGDNKITRERNLSSILNGGVEVFEGAINIDVSEEARWLD